MRNTWHIIGIILFALVCIQFQADAQCAMCKAVPESALENGGDITGKGINKGIIYIMIVPYILLISFLTYSFRKKIKPFLYDMGILKAHENAS